MRQGIAERGFSPGEDHEHGMHLICKHDRTQIFLVGGSDLHKSLETCRMRQGSRRSPPHQHNAWQFPRFYHSPPNEAGHCRMRLLAEGCSTTRLAVFALRMNLQRGNICRGLNSVALFADIIGWRFTPRRPFNFRMRHAAPSNSLIRDLYCGVACLANGFQFLSH